MTDVTETTNVVDVIIPKKKQFRKYKKGYQTIPFEERSKNPLYEIYRQMLTRTYNPNHRDYKFYGGRGIKVARRWLGKRGMIHFVEDMGPRPEGTRANGWALFTIERRNNNKSYTPSNCYWCHFSKQYSNQRKPVKRVRVMKPQI